MNRLKSVSKMTSFEIIKSASYQGAKNAVKTTRMVKEYANKSAQKRGTDSRFNQRARKTSGTRGQKWAFGEAVMDGEQFGYGCYPLPMLKKYGVVRYGKSYRRATWRGSRLRMVSRGLGKSGWVGVLRRLSRQYGQDKYSSIPKREPGMSALMYAGIRDSFARVRRRLNLSIIEGLIINATKPITYLDRRDNLATKAMNMTRGFIRRVMIPDARKQLAASWK